jgi:hypothetical protein
MRMDSRSLGVQKTPSTTIKGAILEYEFPPRVFGCTVQISDRRERRRKAKTPGVEDFEVDLSFPK